MIKFFSDTLETLCQQPVVLLLLMAIPLVVIAKLTRVFPSKKSLWLVALPALVSLAFSITSSIGWFVIALDLLAIFVLVVDLLTIVPRGKFMAQRKCLKIASLDKSHEVEIAVANNSSRSCRVEIRDDLPDQFSAQPAFFQQKLQGRSRSFFSYKFKSTERGKFDLENVHVKVASLLGFWRGYFKIPVETEINVYPDMKQITQFELLARTNRLRLLGVRRIRRIGTDNEFERLRDYTQDDNFRHIDWRTTARRRKLTVKDFQTNQSQRIIFLVDCGRMMTGQSGDITMLDHSLNAMLMLSYVALKQGDSVGLVCFSDKIHNYTPARSGVNHINRLLHASFDLKPDYVESRYDSAFLHVSKNCRKRALVVLLTNVIDDINATQIRSYLGSMAGKHLPMGVLLRDHELFDVVDEYQADQSTDVYQAAAAADVLTWRHQILNDLSRKGVLTMDVFPDQLTARLVNQYLEIKARHLL
jgi:uncharacterized protein (DUF58 family)